VEEGIKSSSDEEGEDGDGSQEEVSAESAQKQQ